MKGIGWVPPNNKWTQCLFCALHKCWPTDDRPNVCLVGVDGGWLGLPGTDWDWLALEHWATVRLTAVTADVSRKFAGRWPDWEQTDIIPFYIIPLFFRYRSALHSHCRHCSPFRSWFRSQSPYLRPDSDTKGFTRFHALIVNLYSQPIIRLLFDDIHSKTMEWSVVIAKYRQ